MATATRSARLGTWILCVLLAASVQRAAGATLEAGAYHTLVVKSDGTVRAWGLNSSGQLGDATTANRTAPVLASNLTDVVAVAARGFHSLALKSDGTVLACGSNNYGQLGDGTATNRSCPAQVPGLTGAVAVGAGGYHSLAVKTAGIVWAWGQNDYGQLGDGTTTQRNTPVQVTGLSGVAAVAGGMYHSLALKTDGTVWAWGRNNYGQLGDGTTTQRNIPVQVTGLSGVAAVAGGMYHSLALKTDGTVWAWGYNYYGQLGDGTTTSRYIPVQVTGLTGAAGIAAGAYHSLALKTDRTVWAWGWNAYGQLGDGTTTNRNAPAQASGLSGVVTVGAGLYHSLALRSDGTGSAWGYNYYGQLGDGTTTSRSAPVQVVGLVWDDLRFNVDVRFPPPQTADVVMPAAAGGGLAEWRFILSDPGAGWSDQAFDDSSWMSGSAGFGSGGCAEPLDTVATSWTSSQIWLRRAFVLDAPDVALVLWGRWDDAISVYINGVPALNEGGWAATYRYKPISKEALASLHPGVNTIAVTVIDYGGGRYFDMGLALNPMRNMPVSGYAVNPALDSFDAAALQYFIRNIIPAAAVAVMKEDRIVFKRGYGYMDKYRTAPVPADAIFRLASLDKTPGAAAIRRLIDDGFVDPVTGMPLTLDTPVFPLLEARGLQPLPGRTPDPRIDQITVQHIIEHRSGLSELSWAADMLAQTGVPLNQYSSNDNVRYVYSQPLAFAPGSDNRYCSSAFMVLRYLVDVLTGGFEAYFHDVVMSAYGSLGMGIVHEPISLRSPLEPWYQTEEMPFEREIYLDHFFALTASAEAYARFCRGYNLWTGQRLIDPATGAWAPVPDNGWTYFTGGMSGTRTWAIQRRWDQVTIVILSNSNTELGPLADELYAIVDTLPANAWTLTGDINGDGYVNVGDLQLLVAAWGSQAGPPVVGAWNAAGDLNRDGYVNVGDLQLLVANWGRSVK